MPPLCYATRSKSLTCKIRPCLNLFSSFWSLTLFSNLFTCSYLKNKVTADLLFFSHVPSWEIGAWGGDGKLGIMYKRGYIHQRKPRGHARYYSFKWFRKIACQQKGNVCFYIFIKLIIYQMIDLNLANVLAPRVANLCGRKPHTRQRWGREILSLPLSFSLLFLLRRCTASLAFL